MLKKMVSNAPSLFPQDRRDFMLGKIQTFESDPTISTEEIDKTIAEFGKEIWAYRKAFESL